MITYTVAAWKGGSGKTSTSQALALALHHAGYRVLAVDLDPQSNLSICSGIDPIKVESTLYDVFNGAAKMTDAIYKSKLGFDIISGGLSLSTADMTYVKTGREYMLNEALEKVKDKYQYCVIDTCPSLGILTTNAMTATVSNDAHSGGVIIPVTTDIFAIQGLAQLKILLDSVKKYSNKSLRIAGILITQYDDRYNIAKALVDQIDNAAKALGTKVYSSKIRTSVAIREAQLLQSDFYLEAPKANATVDYVKFAEELIDDEKRGNK